MNCREVRKRMAEDSQQAFEDPAVTAHLQGCASCRGVRERLERVDLALEDLGPVAPSAAVVERTRAAVERRRTGARRILRLALALGVPLVLVLAGVVFIPIREMVATSANALAGDEPTEIPDRFAGLVTKAPEPGERSAGAGRYSLGPRTPPATTGRVEAGTTTAWNDEVGLEVASRPSSVAVGSQDGHGWYNGEVSSPPGGVDRDLAPSGPIAPLVRKRERTFPLVRLGDDRAQTGEPEPEEDAGVLDKSGAGDEVETIDRSEVLGCLEDTDKLARQVRIVPSVQDGEQDGFRIHGVRPGSVHDRLGLKNGDVIHGINGQPIDTPDKALQAYARVKEAERLELDVSRGGERRKLTLRVRDQSENEERNQRDAGGEGRLVLDSQPRTQVFIDGRAVDAKRRPEIELAPGVHRVRIVKRNSLPVERDVTIREGEKLRLSTVVTELPPLDALEFIPASGYFENTYLPGDPQLAWLKSQLSRELYLDGRTLVLERAAVPYRQPFDPPANAGLAVYLQADRTGVEGRRRLTLQVGLKGSERHARRRGALDAVLVVDLRSPPCEESRRTLWKLAATMASDQQAGDRFHLVVAAPGAPQVVEPGRFGPNTVRSALARALERRLAHPEEQGGSLGDVLERAYGLLRGHGDAETPLGAKLVLLASAGSLETPDAALLEKVHRAALDGIPLTVIGAGGKPGIEALGLLARTGQGRRRLVRTVDEAGPVLQEELSASGRVVARAVRLRIRLAEGVKLVEVLGSRRLDAVDADRVRQTERAVDRRVARTLGIRADRGEDEDGIQVVIPAFYAGDDHVILLDVVVPGPGPVAEVRVRYKDLVNLDNAVARASLSLPAGGRGTNLLVLNVHKNVLAQRLSQDLFQAAGELEAGRTDGARRFLARAEERIAMLRAQHPGLDDDPELQRDVGMLAAYRRVLDDEPAWRGDSSVRRHLVLSLAYAGRVKLPPGAPR